MPSYYDEKTKKWYCKFYYTDWTGQRKPKMKRGFKLKREANDWERDFLERMSKTPDMSFSNLIDLYFEDAAVRLRVTTLQARKELVARVIAPYFNDQPVNSITVSDIRNWQNKLISYRNSKGKPHAPSSLRHMHRTLSTLFNFAVRFYGLNSNPCKLAGPMGSLKGEAMHIWTKDAFQEFLTHLKKDIHIIPFTIMFWTGMRVGEVLALTPNDLDFNENTININKTYKRIKKQDLILPPKTVGSNRIVHMPQFLADQIKDYMAKKYKLKNDERLFLVTNNSLNAAMNRVCKEMNVTHTRIHNLRHSHASMLIEIGASPLLIAERLGHVDVATTLNTYSHLYPNKQKEVVKLLEDYSIKSVS